MDGYLKYGWLIRFRISAIKIERIKMELAHHNNDVKAPFLFEIVTRSCRSIFQQIRFLKNRFPGTLVPWGTICKAKAVGIYAFSKRLHGVDPGRISTVIPCPLASIFVTKDKYVLWQSP